MWIKKIIKKRFPFLLSIILIPEYFVDYLRYLKFSGVLGLKSDKKKLIAKIIAEYHVVEKGLTMPDVRLGFGNENLISLINNCFNYINIYENTDSQIKHAVSVILEYKKFHNINKYSLDTNLIQKIESLKSKFDNITSSNQIIISNKEYFKNKNESFNVFSNTRKSIRNYSDEIIPITVIEKAVDLARNAPSSCNRQGARVHVFSSADIIKKILALQGGNRGFGHLTNKLIVVTEELGISHGVYERHQVYVDGGMYAMNLLYSLHHNNVAACSLNCNFSIKKDKQMRSLCDIKDSEVFIMMISCGYAPDQFKVSLSERYPVKEILTFNS